MSTVPTPRFSAADDTLHQQAEFRALCSRDGSLAAAALAYTKARPDAAAFVCDEVLRDHLLLEFDATRAALETQADPAAIEFSLSAQRAAMAAGRGRLLATLASRDAALLEEIRYTEAQLATPAITGLLRADLERDLAIARLCRSDLLRLTRIVLEQRAMQEARAALDGPAPSMAMLDLMVAAAQHHTAVIDRPLREEWPAPLRQTLAVDLAMEANAREAAQRTAATTPTQPPSRSAARTR